MQKEYIEREALNKVIDYEIEVCNSGIAKGVLEMLKVRVEPAADVVEADRLGRVGRLMLTYKGCPRGPMGRLGMAGGKTRDKKAILVEELCCMDTFEDVDGNVWRPVQEEVLQEVIEILRAQSTVLTVEPVPGKRKEDTHAHWWLKQRFLKEE